MQVGDRVAVRDEGLAMLTSIMLQAGEKPKVANNVGVIDEIADGTAFIIFDDSGQCAPYPLTDCYVIAKAKHSDGTARAQEEGGR